MYYINGYKFNTKGHGQGMRTTNCGVYVQGGDNESIENDYYGVLTDIVEVSYTGWPIKTLVLFKCDWFDPTPNQGTKIDNYGFVDVKASRRYKNYDPFIFAQQAKQVYYTQYPEGQNGWLVVMKTKSRSTIQILETNKPERDSPYQDESIPQSPVIIANDNLEESLVDIAGEGEEVFAHALMELSFEEEDDFEVEDSAEEDEEGEGQKEDDDNEETYSD